MWTCPKCGQEFRNENTNHACNVRTLESFLLGKPEHIRSAFDALHEYVLQLTGYLAPTKTMIALAGKKRFGYIYQITRNRIELVLLFHGIRHEDNLCFSRIANVPGSNQYNHVVHLTSADDFNDEVKKFVRMAYEETLK